MATLTIHNDGPRIVSTNFWDTDYARAGAIYLSVNAGAVRLLLPRALEPALVDMETATEVLVSRGPWPERRRDDAIEVLFGDSTDNPFALHCSIEQIDRLLADTDAGRELVFSVWTAGPTLRLTRPGYYRRVSELPWLKSR